MRSGSLRKTVIRSADHAIKRGVDLSQRLIGFDLRQDVALRELGARCRQVDELNPTALLLSGVCFPIT